MKAFFVCFLFVDLYLLFSCCCTMVQIWKIDDIRFDFWEVLRMNPEMILFWSWDYFQLICQVSDFLDLPFRRYGLAKLVFSIFFDFFDFFFKSIYLEYGKSFLKTVFAGCLVIGRRLFWYIIHDISFWFFECYEPKCAEKWG